MSAVDVLAVMDSAESVLRSNIRRCNNKASRGEPHQASLIKQQRAAYLLEHYAAARAAVAELIEADKEYDAALAAYATATRNESIHRMADRHAAAVERRKAALAACQSPTTPLTREQEAEEVHKR